MSKACDSCGKKIPKTTTSYCMKIDLFADPSPPVVSQDDMEKDWKAEMQALIEQMEKMTPHEVHEAEDQVYESYLFTLCPKCRLLMHNELRGRKQR